MALVTYHGPRPELVPALPLPTDAMDTGAAWRSWERDGLKRPRLVRLEAPVLVRDMATPVPALFALGLARIRRRPSPWFTIRLGLGEYAEIAWRVPNVTRVECACTIDDSGERCAPDAMCEGCGGRGWIRLYVPYRTRVLRYLGWTPGQIAELYAGERKPMYVNGDLVYSPPGWAPVLA